MPLFHINSENIHNKYINITGDDFHHIIHSLRKKKNDIIKFTDSKNIYKSKIINISKKNLIAEIISSEKVMLQKKLKIILCVALIKFDNFEQILRWGTALGIYKFYPLITQNSQKIKISSSRWQRWNKIIKESAIQSENPQLPVICKIINFKDSLKMFDNYFKILFHPYTENNLREILKDNQNRKIVIYIGSESGFTDAEVEFALENNVQIAKLSGNILRTEVAALVALSNILFFYE